MLIMELPPYRRPLARTVARHVWDRARLFLAQAGTLILIINIFLWFLVYYPRSPRLQAQFESRRAAARALVLPGSNDPAALEEARSAELARLDLEEKGALLRSSFAGRLGRLIEPVIAPLGFDWKIGVGIISSFAAREVFVSSMSQVYNVGEGKTRQADHRLIAAMREQKRPDGSPLYTARLGLTLMVFYVFALQCASTVAIVRRETNSWKWAAFAVTYSLVLAWVTAFLIYRIGLLLGFRG
jgi:ferrous iron transport protein B